MWAVSTLCVLQNLNGWYSLVLMHSKEHRGGEKEKRWHSFVLKINKLSCCRFKWKKTKNCKLLIPLLWVLKRLPSSCLLRVVFIKTSTTLTQRLTCISRWSSSFIGNWQNWWPAWVGMKLFRGAASTLFYFKFNISWRSMWEIQHRHLPGWHNRKAKSQVNTRILV